MKKILSSVIIMLLFSVSYAQNDTLVSHYRQMALEYQQSVKMAEHSLSGAQSKVEAAQAGRLPQLDFNGRYSYFGEGILQAPTDVGVPGEEINHFYSLNLDLYQPILTGGYLINKKRIAESETNMMQNLVYMNKQQVMLRSDRYYWNAVAKNEMLKLNIKYQEVLADFVKVIKDRVDEEVTGMNELYQSKVRYNQAGYDVINSKKELQVSMMKLNRLIGLPLDTPVYIADSLIVVQWNQAVDTLAELALSQRPEISFLKNQVMKNQYTEKITGSKYMPQLGALIGGKWGAPAPGLEKDPGFNYYLKAQLSIPIFHWNQKHKEVFAMRQQTEISKLQMQQTKDQITLQVESSYYKLERSQEQLDFAKSSLDNAKKNVDVFLDRYNEGLSSVLEVLDAQLGWQQTYRNYIMAKYDLNVAYSDYLYALGEFSKMSKENQ
jgi:outer membrane protein TolC